MASPTLRKFISDPASIFRTQSAGIRHLYSLLYNAFSPSYRIRRKLAHTAIKPDTAKVPHDKGFLVVDNGDVFNCNEVIKFSLNTCKNCGPNVCSEKDYLNTGLVPYDQIGIDHPLLKFALDENILSIATEYFQAVPLLVNLGVWRSSFSPEQASGSQLFHCDNLDTTQLKVFIYATDVSINDGPLTLIDATKSSALRKKLNYKWTTKRYRVSDQEVEDTIGSSCIKTLTAPKGTMVFGDTSRCFHYGSRVTKLGKERIVAVAHYASSLALARPEAFVSGLPMAHLKNKVSNEVHRYVLAGTD
ncbi:phytanoyl-CoA dioxygenase family protein [Ketobacter alkanivorans]|nr:hypothetical protein [Ketobacter alkanivorans]